jgi:hypothetical protein
MRSHESKVGTHQSIIKGGKCQVEVFKLLILQIAN